MQANAGQFQSLMLWMPSTVVGSEVLRNRALNCCLEIEAGVSALHGHGQTEWDSDLIFKKPFTLSDEVEFMIGAGPEWTYTTGGEGAKVSAEVAPEFMIWPTKDRKFGWFIEPTYSYALTGDHQKSLGLGAGLMIPIP